MRTIEYDLSTPATALEALAKAMQAGDKVTMVPVDPYWEYRRAQAIGEIVQYQNAEGEWVDPPESVEHWDFCYPPDRYRIKPDSEPVWQWLYRLPNGAIQSTVGFFPNEGSAKRSLGEACEILQRADWTEIEVYEVGESDE